MLEHDVLFLENFANQYNFPQILHTFFRRMLPLLISTKIKRSSSEKGSVVHIGMLMAKGVFTV